MLGRNGDTADTIRELIAVPPEMEAALLAYAGSRLATADERRGIERVLRFRKRVAEEFEQLVAQATQLCLDVMSGRPQVVETVPQSRQAGIVEEAHATADLKSGNLSFGCGDLPLDSLELETEGTAAARGG